MTSLLLDKNSSVEMIQMAGKMLNIPNIKAALCYLLSTFFLNLLMQTVLLCKLGKRRYICYLPGGRSVWEKTVPEVLSTARGRRPRAVLKTKGTVFSHTRDRPSPVNNIFIFFLQYIGFTEY